MGKPNSKEVSVSVGKIIFRVSLFLLLLGGLLWRAYLILDWKDTTGEYLSSLQQLYHTPENTVDVVFLGSSHCYCSIYPAYLWRDGGISAFDMAVSGQDKDSTYHTLIETLKTQKPKVAFVELYGLFFDRHGIEGNIYRNMLSMKFSRNSVELIKDHVEPEQQGDFLLRWPIIHTRFWEVDKYDYVQYEPSIYGRGADYQWHVEETTPGDAMAQEQGRLTDNNAAWLEKLRTLCADEQIDLVFFVAPFTITEEEQLQVNAAKKYAEEYDIPFMDFNRMRYEIGLDDETDFVDSFHCNAYGAEKVTGYVRNYLQEHYQLADHRGESAYELWDRDYNWYLHLENQAKLENAATPEEYMELIAKQDELFCVISVDGVIDHEQETILERLGLKAEESRMGGKWCITSGNIIKIMDNTPGEEFALDLNEYDSIRIRCSEEKEPSDIRINYDDYLNPVTDVTIVAYDLFLKEVLPTNGF